MQIVYVLTNEAMPGLVKIGRTSDSIEARISQLSNCSGVPLRFECYYAAQVDDAERIEKTLHQLFADHRISKKREFFRIDAEKVVVAISLANPIEVTPGVIPIDEEEEVALAKAKARRPRLRLSALGINPGAKLTFSRDEDITATVVEGNTIDLNGEQLSLSAAAVKVLTNKGYKSLSASGSDYWMFEGELLDERRRRMEAEQLDEASETEQ
jgi:hypothetical protein